MLKSFLAVVAEIFVVVLIVVVVVVVVVVVAVVDVYADVLVIMVGVVAMVFLSSSPGIGFVPSQLPSSREADSFRLPFQTFLHF